ncbi:MAG: 1,4-alpha-glucan branching protein GlgB [Dehalococcoidia bacterium]
MSEKSRKQTAAPTETPLVRHDVSLITDDDLYLFNEGTHFKLHEKLGSHPMEVDGVAGFYFAVWAPDARHVSVMGDFNGWSKTSHMLRVRGGSGIWEGFIPGVVQGSIYKYGIASQNSGYTAEKADPFAVHQETPPKTGSILWDTEYQWGDAAWMHARADRNRQDSPISTYEVHLGSWMRPADDPGRFLTYREVAPLLADYVSDMGFTHVEFMPLMEHPFYGSWGYQVTGYFAPTSRFGTPQDLMYLIDVLHQRGIGVILDWVPSHFPSDAHGLAYFDGSHLYEHEDPRQGFHPDWKSYIFNYGRHEVRSFLISNALYWLDLYHADGLRVDGVASMLYLDYSREAGEWVPNQYGGRENLDAIDLFRRFNTAVYGAHPDVQTYAEESTSWPMVSKPVYLGGLGFGFKWDMGWMHDTLQYMSYEPIHRSYHHSQLTFRQIYAYHENFVLPLSHDEVVYGKHSLLGKMPGDAWRQFANLRLLLGYMYAQPGKKLLFMGGEFGQGREWDHDSSLDWPLLDIPWHAGVRDWTRQLNHLYRNESALHHGDTDESGFEWVDASDTAGSVISFLRKSHGGGEEILVVCNFTPITRENYAVGVPRGGYWRELLNSDAAEYQGSGAGNLGGVHAQPVETHGRPFSLDLTLPPLGVLFLKREG